MPKTYFYHDLNGKLEKAPTKVRYEVEMLYTSTKTGSTAWMPVGGGPFLRARDARMFLQGYAYGQRPDSASHQIAIVSKCRVMRRMR